MIPFVGKQHREQLTGAWSFDQARDAVKVLRKEIGDGWDWLVPEAREALVAQRALSIILRNHRSFIEQLDMQKLLSAMRVCAGLIAVEEVVP